VFGYQWGRSADDGRGAGRDCSDGGLYANNPSLAAIAFNARSLLGPNCMRITVLLTGSVPLDDFSTAAYATMDASLASFYDSPAYAAVKTWLQANFPTG
jgi:hypothetical protein